jgi:NTP pyrophosphatase (non-canonical NTP hydrolase)
MTIFQEIAAELDRARRLQLAGKFAKTIMQCNDLEALSVLTEEVGEVAHEVNEGIGKPACKERTAKMREELVQVAAMAVGWVYAIDGVEGSR